MNSEQFQLNGDWQSRKRYNRRCIDLEIWTTIRTVFVLTRHAAVIGTLATCEVGYCNSVDTFQSFC